MIFNQVVAGIEPRVSPNHWFFDPPPGWPVHLAPGAASPLRVGGPAERGGAAAAQGRHSPVDPGLHAPARADLNGCRHCHRHLPD